MRLSFDGAGGREYLSRVWARRRIVADTIFFPSAFSTVSLGEVEFNFRF
jgi:hypothetical protein